MEEFNGFNYNKTPDSEPVQEKVEEVAEPQTETIEVAEFEAPMDTKESPQEENVSVETESQTNFVPPYNPVNYSRIVPTTDYKPMSVGLKVFVFIMVAVIALTSAVSAGYFLGKGGGNKTVSVGLDAKPKKGDEMTAAQVYEKVNPNVVGIVVYNSKGVGANASGVIYSKDGFIVTNDHIYSEVGAAKFKVYTYDGKEYDAKYVAGDKVSDLAVLKVDGAKFEAALFGDSNQIIYGESVVAVGRPGGASDSSSITKGIVSATSRRVQTTSSYSSRLIETDCPINPGSSGGALVNMYGQIIGITSSKLASTEIDAIGYAIPTTTVKRIVEELIKSGSVVTRAKLGITYQAVDSVAVSLGKYKYKGLYVDSVSADSDLYQKVQQGDIITHINDIEIISDVVVLDIIEKSKAGDTIKVTFVNEKGKTKTVNAVLKANVSESSYSSVEKIEGQIPGFSGGQDNSQQGGGAFDFPFGE